MAERIQRAFRCHLARNRMRRLRKLLIFKRETSAAVTIQSFFRVRHLRCVRRTSVVDCLGH